MQVARLLAIVLGLMLVFVGGCDSSEPRDIGEMLSRASQDIVGGRWEDPDDPGNALIFRPNGTGQSHLADSNVTADIVWSMDSAEEHVQLTWSYRAARSEAPQEWIVEIDGDTMGVWPQAGSLPVLDADSDEPFVLQRVY